MSRRPAALFGTLTKYSDAKYLSNEVLKYVLKYYFGTYLLVLKYFRKLVLTTYT